jgi:hypothetical protein
MEGGEAVFDSRVIVEYLDTLSPVGKLIPSTGRERAEVKTWEALADGLLDAAILVRLENTFEGRKPSERSQAWIDRQMDKVHASLKAMAQGLGDKPLLQRHPPEPVRHCRGLRAGLAGVPLPRHRLARRIPQPGQAHGQARAARQLCRHQARLTRRFQNRYRYPRRSADSVLPSTSGLWRAPLPNRLALRSR